MAEAKVAKGNLCEDLESLKRESRQVRTWGLSDLGDPILQFHLSDFVPIVGEGDVVTLVTESVAIAKHGYLGQMGMLMVDGDWILYLFLTRTGTESELISSGTETVKELSPFTFFVCKFTNPVDVEAEGSCWERCVLSGNAFESGTEINRLEFRRMKFSELSVYVVDAYQSLSMDQFLRFGNCGLGRLDRFQETLSRVVERHVVIVGSSFTFGDLEMMVRFWCSNGTYVDHQVFSATFRLFDRNGGIMEPPFHFHVFLTLFNQRNDGVDLVTKVQFLAEKRETDYPTYIANVDNLEPCGFLVNDTIYFKVSVEDGEL